MIEVAHHHTISYIIRLQMTQEVTSRVFMPLFECPSKRCKLNNAKGNIILQLRASKFLKFQEVVYLDTYCVKI